MERQSGLKTFNEKNGLDFHGSNPVAETDVDKVFYSLYTAGGRQ